MPLLKVGWDYATFNTTCHPQTDPNQLAKGYSEQE